MLKFFRNIRRRLLQSGKVKSYALYAIGEILLVIVGILIALNINNQNEERKDRLISFKRKNDIIVGFTGKVWASRLSIEFQKITSE